MSHKPNSKVTVIGIDIGKNSFPPFITFMPPRRK
jgi:hypothetical protein